MFTKYSIKIIYVTGSCALHFAVIKSIHPRNIKSETIILLNYVKKKKTAWKKQREITLKLWSSEVCSWQENKRKKMAEIQNLGSWEFWFLYTALLHYEIYPPVQFQVSSLNNFGFMLRTRQCGKTLPSGNIQF